MGVYQIRAARTVGREHHERKGEAHTQVGLGFAVRNLLRLIGTSPGDSATLLQRVGATSLEDWVFSIAVNDTQLSVKYQNDDTPE